MLFEVSMNVAASIRSRRRLAAVWVGLPVVFAGIMCGVASGASPPKPAVAAGVSATPVRDPAGVACPAAPMSWNDPPVLKTLSTPETVPEPAAEEHWATGGNVVSVNCTYRDTPDKSVTVEVSFALPTDANPFADFDVGCGRGGTNWETTYRSYGAASVTEWAIATFADPNDYLSSDSIPAFETLTQKLLQNAKGYGAPCSLKSVPTSIAFRLHFDILVNGTNIKDTFWTADSPTAGGVLPIQQILSTTNAINVKTRAGTRLITIRLTKGVDYLQQHGRTPGRARFRVVVVNSKIAGCSAGASGTLTISTRPSVILALCGQQFLKADAPPRIAFFG